MEQTSPLVHLIACPSLALEHGKIDRYVPEGGTVADHLRAIGWQPDRLNARVFIDGVFIEQAQWEYAAPLAGQAFITRVIPMGGGEGGKSALRIVAMLAIVAAAVATGQLEFIAAYGPLAGPLVTAAISIAGSLALSGLIPAPLPRRALPQPMPERNLQEAA